MAVLDGDASEVVIRVVYDGPPEAGKTTSLRALAGSLATASTTPEEDDAGRTQWFDWMEYTGGRYEGCRIRCQVVSVPGQPALAARRRRLLDGADVVVCVADSGPTAWEASLAHLARLRQELAGVPAPAPGVVVQANKRDVAGAIAIEDLRDRLAAGGPPTGLVESIAADGTGIRETFVYAVRLALDRVRELMTRGALASRDVEIDTPATMLARMQAAEAEAVPAPVRLPRIEVIEARDESLAAGLLRDVLDEEHEAAAGRVILAVAPGSAPLPPDTSVPSGAIWPPVEGRAILHEVSQQRLVPRRMTSGDWAAGLGSGWRVVSSRDAVRPALDPGRGALIQWARLHASCLPVVSPRRCIVLADAGDGGWRLWQIVHAEESLRDLINQAMCDAKPERLVFTLCQAAQLLLDADRKLANAPCALSCSIDSIGMNEGSAMYIGLMPEQGAATEPDPARVSAPMLLRTQLGPLVMHDLAERRRDLLRLLDRVPRQFVQADTIVPTLSALLQMS